MNYAIRFLRQELNREISFATQFKISVKMGRKISESRILDMSIRNRENRIPSLRSAILALKHKPRRMYLKPFYYWTPRVTNGYLEHKS